MNSLCVELFGDYFINWMISSVDSSPNNKRDIDDNKNKVTDQNGV